LLQAFKRQQAEMPLTNDKAKLVQLLKEAKNQKLHYQKQCEQLTQKLSEASGDIKVSPKFCQCSLLSLLCLVLFSCSCCYLAEGQTVY